MSKDIRLFLSHQSRDVPLSFGGRIDFFGLLTFANDAADFSIANSHHEFVDSGIVRQRKDVNSFDLCIVRIVKLLCDINSRDVSVDGAFNSGML